MLVAALLRPPHAVATATNDRGPMTDERGAMIDARLQMPTESVQAGGAFAGDVPPDVPEKERTVMPAPLRGSCPQYGAAHSKPALGPIRSLATAKVILPKPMPPAQGSCLRASARPAVSRSVRCTT